MFAIDNCKLFFINIFNFYESLTFHLLKLRIWLLDCILKLIEILKVLLEFFGYLFFTKKVLKIIGSLIEIVILNETVQNETVFLNLRLLNVRFNINKSNWCESLTVLSYLPCHLLLSLFISFERLKFRLFANSWLINSFWYFLFGCWHTCGTPL